MTEPEVQRFTDLGDGRSALEIWRKRDAADCVGVGDVWEYFALLPPDVVAANRADLGLPPTNEKACTAVPCPSFEDVELDVLAVCDCFGRLNPGDLYAPGCPVHDPEASNV